MAGERTTALVLVADDDQDIRDLVQLVLFEDGYDVLGARNGTQAVKLATEQLPDLCILDVMMPGMDGCQATRALRAQPETADIPIMLLSAKTQWEAVVAGKEAGADEYLTKPFIPDDLQREVRAMLAMAREPAPAPESLELGEGIELVTEPEQPSGNGGPGTALVAATDENVTKLIAYRLKLDGWDVVPATTGEEAIRLATERAPDLCVLDQGMAAPNGHPVAWIEQPFDLYALCDQIEQVVG
jgi:DNA-binding response OmpR family regulator